MNDAEYREEQIEALKTLVEYSRKLNNGIKIVADELSGNRKEDTDDFFMKVINGINWELEVLNACLTLVNEKEVVIDKDIANKKIIALSEAIKLHNDMETAEILRTDILPLMEQIASASEKIIA